MEDSAAEETAALTLRSEMAAPLETTADEVAAAEVDSLREKAGSILLKAGADHVIDTIADLPDLLSWLDP